jgi:invasion protein IalB
MRFVPVLPNLTQAWDTAGTAYSGPSWLYCRAEFSYQAALGVTLPPYFARREPTERRRLRAVGREREKRTIVMTHRIATAWPRGRVLTATLAGMLAAAFVAVPALAQQPPPKAAPAQKQAPAPAQKQAPAAQPAQPAQPGQPGQAGQPGQQQAAAEQPQLMYSPWMKVCGKGPDTNNKQVCVITKDGRLENGMPVAIVQLFEPEGGQKVLRVTVPLGMQIAHGTRLLIDQGQPTQSPYSICFPVGCMADYQVPDDMIAKMKKGQNIVVQAINMQGTPISLPLPLNDFAKAYDGPPTDPKAFEEQQRKLQEELQKKAEEARKKLEGQQSQAPAPAQPGAFAPAQKK